MNIKPHKKTAKMNDEFSVEFSVNSENQFHVVWEPEFPKRGTRTLQKKYRRARNSFFREVADLNNMEFIESPDGVACGLRLKTETQN